MNILRNLSLIFPLLILAPSSWANEAKTDELHEVPAKQSSRDVKIPSSMVQMIEKDYRSFRAQYKIKEEEPIIRNMLNVYVDLTQKRAAALNENVRVKPPFGGGVIDLKDFVTPLIGAFKVQLVFEKEGKVAPDNYRVYFVSRGKQRKIEKQTFGAGCGKYYDITSEFNRTLGASGLEVFTKDQRYLSVLAGTFVMVSFDKEKLFVGAITFEDSRYPQWQCEE